MKRGDRVRIFKPGSFYNGRVGVITDSIEEDGKIMYRVVLDNFNDIGLWFAENELRLQPKYTD